eukprot:scaffold2398_cov339-Prasinococcus_capsulatus_cf.AAC.1
MSWFGSALKRVSEAAKVRADNAHAVPAVMLSCLVLGGTAECAGGCQQDGVGLPGAANVQHCRGSRQGPRRSARGGLCAESH